MQKKEHIDLAVLLYIMGLIFITIMNMLNNVRDIDIIYVIALSCCLFKFLLLKRR